MSRHHLSVMALAAILGTVFLTPVPVKAQSAVVQPQIPQSRAQITLSFAPLVKLTAPAVVNIYTSKLVRQSMMSPLFNDPVFQRFFGLTLPPGMTRERMQNSLGSGVLVRADGLIVTSAHVIEGADEIRVVLADRREFVAKLLAKDEQTDLAVLRLETRGEHLPYLELADSDSVTVGDLVIAIGNPFGVGQTVTSGIVSALARTGVGLNDLNYFIQTDAAINPGNSGGALVGMDGKLVGINAAIYSPSGGNLGIGFAMPANMVRAVVQAVEQGKDRVVRPWLGLDGQDMTPELARSLGVQRPVGVLVRQMHPASPPLTAGLRVGDVIMTLNGHEVEDSQALRFRIATLPVGGTGTLGVWRKGQVSSLPFKLAAPPEIPPRKVTPVTGNNPLNGATIVNISPAVVEEMGLHEDDSDGVIVSAVKPRSPAGRIGVRPGDIFSVINERQIFQVDDVTQALAEARRGWQIQIRRDGRILSVYLDN
ncbi:MAG: Do family serine endopeptidase [Alphaproteobacteria bacterium]